MAAEESPVQPPPEEPAASASPGMEPAPAQAPGEGLAAEAQLLSDAELAARVEEEAAPWMEPGVHLAPEVESTIKRGLGVRLGEYVRKNPLQFSGWTVLILALILGFVWPDVPIPHVALGGEPISVNGPSWLTNSFLTVLIVDVVLLVIALATRVSLKLVPGGLQNFMELLLEYFYGLAEQIAGKAARNYFPWIMTIFLLVILSNWTGLIPGVGSIGFEQTHVAEHEEAPAGETGWNADAQLAMADGNLILLADAKSPAAAPRQEEPAAGVAPTAEEEEAAAHFVPLFRAPSADLNLTFALAISTMVMVQVWGVRALGGSYFRKFFNANGKGFMKGISVFVGLLELISEFARIISFGFRLFGNIFAGEIVLATMAFLAAFVLPVPFYLLELFVGFVQALVFTMLALVFFSMATIGHAEHHEEAHGEAPAPAGAAAAAH